MTTNAAPGLTSPSAWVIPFGLGAGNIGDELLHRAMWQRLDPAVSLAIGVFPEAHRQRGGYPAQHRYYSVGPGPALPGLLIGGTITEAEGLDYPLRFLAGRLDACHSQGFPVDALGVGVDVIATPEGRRLFTTHFASVRHWAVRTAACREALLDLNIPAERIQVAADWAWLYEPRRDLDAWAREEWLRLGWDPRRPLALVNLVKPPDDRWLAALQELACDFHLGFAAQEVRPAFDQRAIERCSELGLALPLAYYSPDEMIALLRPASMAVAQRYHFAVQAMLAGVPAVLLGRPGRKMHCLAADVNAPIVEDPAQLLREATKVSRAGLADVSEIRKRAESLISAVNIRLGSPMERERVTVLHVGGLGDLILAQPLITALRQKFRHVTLICRKPVAPVAQLFPEPPDEVVALEFNPYLEAIPTPQLLERLEALRSLETPNVLISAELRPTWLSWFLAALLDVDNGFISAAAPIPHGLLTALLERFSLEPRPLAAASPATYSHERERYAALAAMFHLELESPRWFKPDRSPNAPTGDYLVCFPGGAAQQRVKTWGPARFREVLQSLTLPVVVAGDQADQADLRASAPPGAQVFIGSPQSLSELAALTAHARAYLANDTGPSHLAQAYGVPGLTIFGGGGGWPVYSPWGPGSLGVVQPLDCFGCDWACAFDQPYCLSEIGVDPVRQALDYALTGSSAPLHVTELPPPAWWRGPAMAGASARHRDLRVQLDQRMQALIDIEHGALPGARAAAERFELALAAAHAEQQKLHAEAALAHQANQALHSVAADRLGKLQDAADENTRLRAECAERGRLLEAASAETESLARTAAQRLLSIQTLTEQIETIRAAAEENNRAVNRLVEEMSALRDTADERQHLLDISQAEAESLRAIAEERGHLLADAVAENISLLAIAEERGVEADRLRAIAEERGRLLEEATVENASLLNIAKERAKVLEFTAAEAERRREILEELSKKLEVRTQEGPAIQ